MFLFHYSTNRQSFNVILFFFSRYQTKRVKFLIRQLMTSQTLRFIFDYLLKHSLTGKKGQEDRNTKSFNILRPKTAF